MVDFLEIIKTRRSVRKFKKEPLPDSDILKIIEAASYAPSGNNKQNWHFIVIKSSAVINSMSEAVKNKMQGLAEQINSEEDRRGLLNYSRFYTVFENAPVTIACIMKPYESPATRILKAHRLEKGYKSTGGLQGVSAAIENILLASKALGYGTCWMTGPMIARTELEKILGVSAPDELVALVPLGVPEKQPPMPDRKKIEEIITFK